MEKIQKNISLKKYTTFKIGGRAKYFLKAKNKKDIINGIEFAKKNNLSFLILGAGSNVLFHQDKDFNGLVIKNEWAEIKKYKNFVFVSSGALLKNLLNFYLKYSLKGMEWSAGIPGTLAGAIFGNAGAFKGEMKDFVKQVESLSFNKGIKIIKRKNKDCKFEYRGSVFKSNKEIILSAKLKFKKINNKKILEKLRKEVQEHILYRKTHHPLEYPNCGSIFKNVPLENISQKILKQFKQVIKNDPFPIIPAAAIIIKAGLKGKTIGGAQVSLKHPNFIINKNKATFKDIVTLINLIKKTIFKKFKIQLNEEINIVRN